MVGLDNNYATYVVNEFGSQTSCWVLSQNIDKTYGYGSGYGSGDGYGDGSGDGYGSGDGDG